MLYGIDGTYVPTIKMNLAGTDYINWQIVKAKLGDGGEITNKDALKKLISHYNRDKGRKLI